ncbi:MAG: hypothetical protein K2V38_06935 [Gemmataceae bacterium]|nr:hypothetical protein [Gemmataceae bacterium]
MMVSDIDPPERRIELTLVVRDETDDPSILNIVRVAFEDGLRGPMIGGGPVPTEPPPEPPPEPTEPLERVSNTQLDELATRAREGVEEALAKVIERFEEKGQEPKFDPANWAEKLSRVWAVIARAKAAGLQLELIPDDPPTRNDGE